MHVASFTQNSKIHVVLMYNPRVIRETVLIQQCGLRLGAHAVLICTSPSNILFIIQRQRQIIKLVLQNTYCKMTMFTIQWCSNAMPSARRVALRVE